MYESYEALMERKLGLVSDRLDKRQGSVIYDALAPNAAETATFYADLLLLEDRTYGDTAIGDDLTRRAAERGVFRKKAKQAWFLGTFFNGDGLGVSIPLGSRFGLEDLTYVVTEAKVDIGQYLLVCEESGRKGNAFLGELLPLSYIEGLARATLVERVVDGEDEESDEALRKRYFAGFDTEAFGGNIADYKVKVNTLSEVGGVKVFPAWQGGGTVKILVVNRSFGTPTNLEVESLQAAIDPTKDGRGEGLAPIGHQVTVLGAEEVCCQISLEVNLLSGRDLSAVQGAIEETYLEYFLGLRSEWADSNGLVVRLSHLEARALAIPGVLDVQNTKINGQNANFFLNEEKIPVLGGLEVTVFERTL